MARGRYGKFAGDEKRMDSAVVSDHYGENDRIEGREVATVRSMLQDKRFHSVRDYLERLRKEGWSKTRLDCVYARASFGIKF